MNFFERQAAARSQSKRLLLLFICAVFAIIGAVSGQCPLSKKKADSSITVSYTRQVAFADAASKASFDAAPDKHIKEVRQ